MKAFFAILLLALAAANSGGKIKSLPGYSGPELSMYSGYITVDEESNRNIFYWLIEAESKASEKPLVVWFQGGPGCSGLGGLFTENGPLRVSGKTVGYSDLSWTKFANMLYIEQPAFVGFSYSDNPLDNNTNDAKAARDNYVFLEQFLVQYPKYQGRDLYFTGESYAGVYIPTLTALVLNGTNTALYNQFQGFAAGNPVMSCQGFIGEGPYYNIENFNLLYWHGLVSYANYANWTANNCYNLQEASGPECTYILNKAAAQVGIIDQELKAQAVWPSLDPDDLYQDFCIDNGTIDFVNTLKFKDTNKCPNIGDYVSTYLNRADVQAAIYARPTVWSECANLNYTISGDSMVPLYQSFWELKPGVKLLVYSGDVDILTVPFGYTQPCIGQISDGLTLLEDWQPWYVNDATAGYVMIWDKFTYATVKGAGHETPEYQPLSAFQMIESFINSPTGKFNINKPTRRMHRNRRVTQGDMLRKFGLAPTFPLP